MYSFGALVLARFPFTDLSGQKRRPALVISRQPSEESDVVVSFITSIARSGPTIAVMEPSPANGLKCRSFVRFDKLATLNVSIIAGQLGQADAVWIALNSTTFFNVFGFQPGAYSAPNAL